MPLIKILSPLVAGSLLLASSGSSLYNKECKSCHGTKADKKVMGKSKAIKGMPVSSIEKNMHDYATGKRKSMPLVKKLKKNFIKKYSEKELHEVAIYIHGL